MLGNPSRGEQGCKERLVGLNHRHLLRTRYGLVIEKYRDVMDKPRRLL
jgi:hypothetical protein